MDGWTDRQTDNIINQSQNDILFSFIGFFPSLDYGSHDDAGMFFHTELKFCAVTCIFLVFFVVLINGRANSLIC